MIPGWKIKRELSRFSQQLKAIPEALYEPVLQARHNAALRKGFEVHEGDIPLAKNLCILLVFQPSGICQSTLDTLWHLVKNGYAPLVVANHPIAQTDMERLRATIWRAIERPNFGYDFGGYRDGILMLERWNIQPDRLLILNDSIWFPTHESEELLDFASSITSGVGGTILRERGESRFLESYFYAIPKSTLSTDTWRNFWNTLELTSNKYKVIRRGERGFSEAMARGGLPLKAAYPYSAFFDALSNQDNSFLHKTLSFGAHSHEEYEEVRLKLLTEPFEGDWRNNALAHIRKTIPREQPYSAYPYAMASLLRYPILKKSNDRVAKLWRSAYMKAIKAGELPAPTETVLHELEQKIKSSKQS